MLQIAGSISCFSFFNHTLGLVSQNAAPGVKRSSRVKSAKDLPGRDTGKVTLEEFLSSVCSQTHSTDRALGAQWLTRPYDSFIFTNARGPASKVTLRSNSERIFNWWGQLAKAETSNGYLLLARRASALLDASRMLSPLLNQDIHGQMRVRIPRASSIFILAVPRSAHGGVRANLPLRDPLA